MVFKKGARRASPNLEPLRRSARHALSARTLALPHRVGPVISLYHIDRNGHEFCKPCSAQIREGLKARVVGPGKYFDQHQVL